MTTLYGKVIHSLAVVDAPSFVVGVTFAAVCYTVVLLIIVRNS